MNFLENKTKRETSGNISQLKRKSLSNTNDPIDDTAVNVSQPGCPKKTANLIDSIDLKEAQQHFFLSLMPYVSKINDEKNKLQFRMETSYLLLKLLNEEKSTKMEDEQRMEISDDDDNG